MRIWCIPKSTSLETPGLPPRIDRDVFIRSPPPPPRLSKQEKLARGVIVYKTRKNKSDKSSKPPLQTSAKSSSLKTSKPGKQTRKVRYADLEESEQSSKDSTEKAARPRPEPKASSVISEWREPTLPLPPARGEISHCRQQSNTSGTSSSCLTTSPASMTTSPQYSSSSGRGSFADVAASPSPTSNTCDTSIHHDYDSSSSSSSCSSSSSSSTSSSPESTLTSYRSRRSDRSTRIKKTVTRSTLSLSVGGFVRRSSVLTEFKSGSCDSSAVIMFPGISRTRERKDRGKTKHRKKGFCLDCFAN